MTEKITAADAIRLLDTGKAVAVDVREPDEYAVGHIPGAKLLPLGQVIDRAAEVLMEAAREKEVIVEKAVITVGAAQPLFLGEGIRQEYGMIRFDAEPFDVSESYLRLMLEN